MEAHKYSFNRSLPAKLYAYCRTIQQYARRMQLEAIPIRVQVSTPDYESRSPFQRNSHWSYMKY